MLDQPLRVSMCVFELYEPKQTFRHSSRYRNMGYIAYKVRLRHNE